MLLRIDSETRTQLVVLPPGQETLAGAPFDYEPHDRTVVSTYYSDWRDVDGVKVPFEIRGKTSITRILNYQINADIDDSVFTPPPDSLKLPTTKKARSK